MMATEVGKRETGNKFLREMSWGRARELCRIELRGHPELEAAYQKWCEANQAEIETMNAAYRGLSNIKRIPAKVH